MADPESFNVTLSMEEGSVHAAPRDDRSYTVTAFDAGRLYLDINHALLPKGEQRRDFKETPTLELVRIVRRNREEGQSVPGPVTELHKRFSIPVACIVFGLIGVPLGIRRSRSGKSAGIAVALAVFLVYYMLLGIGKNLAEARTFSPAAAYWVPNGLMLLAASGFVVFKAREADLGIAGRIAALLRGKAKGTGTPS
jgi:lipopolysaccharide export system permease protein